MLAALTAAKRDLAKRFGTSTVAASAGPQHLKVVLDVTPGGS
jgi:hypothetical protein